MSSLPPEVGDTVLIKTGWHKGKIGTLVSADERSSLDSHSHLGTVLLPDGSLLGPYEMNELERTNHPTEAG